MRKLIIVAITIGLSIQSRAQSLEDSLKMLTPQQLGNYHLQKSRETRTGAILLAGLGLGTMIIGGSILNNSETTVFDESFDNEATTLLTITAVSSALIIISIPIAISSMSHKQKANELLGDTKRKKSLTINVKSSKIPNGYAHQAISLRSIGLNLAF
jgi:hypothetical protein